MNTKMNMEKAIETLNCMQAHFCNNQNSMDNINNIIKLLQCGEKYEEMWDNLTNDLFCRTGKDLMHMNWEDFMKIIKKTKQKYFPKGDK